MMGLMRVGWSLCLAGVLAAPSFAVRAEEGSAADKAKKAFNIDQPKVGTEKTVFDKGESDDILYKPRDEKEIKRIKDKKKNTDTKTIRAINYHVKNLRDPDPEVRISSCEMLSALSAYTAVPELIAVLDPARNEKIGVMGAANGALVKITGKNFGYKNHEGWAKWWAGEGEAFLQKAETGPDERSKIKAEAMNTIGRELMNQGQYAGALEQFVAAIDADPTKPDYRNNAGLACLELGAYTDGMEYFQEVIGTNPDLPQPYLNIGQCYHRMNKMIEAQSYFKKAMDMDKSGNLYEPIWQIGRVYMQRTEWALAFEYLDQARVKAQKFRAADSIQASICKDLALTHYGMDQFHSAWKEIKNVETLGYQCNASFVAKVKKSLTDRGIDPDVEDRRARAVLRGEDPDGNSSAAKPDEK